MKLTLQGTLQLELGKYGCGNTGATMGPVYEFGLEANTAAPTADAGVFEQTVLSPGAFEDLPWPANLRANMTYLRSVDGAAFEVRFTLADDSTETLKFKGTCGPIEHNPDNPVKGMALKGDGKVRWLATGKLA